MTEKSAIIKPEYYAECQECGDLLPAGRRKFCSKTCSHLAANRAYANRKRSPESTPTNTCQICGKPISGHRTKYCSHTCSRIFLSQRQAARKHQSNVEKIVANGQPKKICVECGREFVSTTYNRLTCCGACSYLHTRKKQARYKDSIRQNIVKYDIATVSESKVRPCLKCGQNFRSRGNYICPRCTVENENICRGSDIGIWNGRGASV